MKHFADQRWADFVRGVGSPEASREIELHLISGCIECQPSLALWKWLEEFGTREAHYEPPENLVRIVKLGFPCRHTADQQGWTAAGLIYDSLRQPLPAGVRGANTTTRQVVYEADGLVVDLRLERKPRSNTICASGQVLDKQAPLSWLDGTAVVLWTDRGRTVGATEANEHGEFQLEFEAQDHLRISIATAGRKTLRIPLGQLE